MTEDLAWAAGFFDGEGTTLTTRPSSSRYRPTLLVSISQLDREVLDRFRAIAGVGHINGPYRCGAKKSPMFAYRTEGPPAKTLINQLWPWLGSLKRAQALRAFEAWAPFEAKFRHRVPNGSPTCIKGHLKIQAPNRLRCRVCGTEASRRNKAA